MHWNQNTCRTCGETGTSYHILFSNDPTPTLVDKIKKCLRLPLLRDDFKPKQVCQSCHLKINDFYDFIRLSYEADQKFEEILSRSNWGHNSSTVIDYTQQKMSVIVAAKPAESESLDIDLYKENMLPSLPLENCPIDENQMLDIVDSGHSFSQENLDYLSADYSRKFQCDLYPEATVLRYTSTQQNACYSESVNEYSMQQNLVQYKDAGQCNKAPAVNLTDLNYPNLCLDYSNYNARTEITSEVDNFESNVVKKPKITPPKSFPCPHCDKTFKHRLNLNSHLAIHTKIRPYVCETCKKSFATKCDLTNHCRIHTDQHKCEFCSSTFPAPSKLQRHLRTHTKEKPFVCDFHNCNKSFADKRNLDGHKLLHVDCFNYTCKVCSKMFKTKKQMKQHMKMHTASAGYVCEVCSKKYKYKSTLIFHLKKHNGYVCCYCSKDCERAVKLIKHKRVCPKRTVST